MFRRTGRPREKPRPVDPKAKFALDFNMITEDEYREILKGNMSLEKKGLFNANARSHIPVGEYEKLYQGRADEILIRRLLREI